MSNIPLKNEQLVPRHVIENMALKKIMAQYPDAINYKSLIRFKHTQGKATLDLDLLPPDLAAKILLIFS